MRKTWLVQRLKKAKDYINPYGNVTIELSSEGRDIIGKVVEPSYMGAAEYEFGAYAKCLSKMWEYGSNNELSIKKLDNYKGSGKTVTVIYNLKDRVDALEDIDYIYDKVAEVRDEGRYSQISKNDVGTFYDTLKNKAVGVDSDIIGWLSIKGYYAFFTDNQIAYDFAKAVGYKAEMDELVDNLERWKPNIKLPNVK